MTPRPQNLSHLTQPSAAVRPLRVSHFAFRISTAFTLIELLVVIAIIITLTALTLPAVKAMSQNNNRSQALNQIRAALSQARSLAIAQHRQAGVVFFEETPASVNRQHTDLTALQLFVEDYNQSQYTVAPKNTVFIAYSSARDYLPAGIHLAVLNDDVNRGVSTGEEPATTGHTRAILFDPQGQMITRHGLARPLFTGTDGTLHKKRYEDWNFVAAGTNSPSVGISSPGVFLYDLNEYLAQHIPTDATGNALRNNWVKQHADLVLLNPNIGTFIP